MSLSEASVHADHRRQGVGKALLTSIASQLSSHGCIEWRLNVFQDNRAALALYMSRGLFIDHSAITYQLSWADIRQVLDPMVELDVHCGPLNSKDDKNIEAEYKLLSGQLQRLRSSKSSFVFTAEKYGPKIDIDGEFKMSAPLCGADLNQISFRGKGLLCFYKNQCNPFFAGSTLIATCLLGLLKRSVGVNQQSEGFHIRILGDCDLHAYVVGLGGKIEDKIYQLKGSLPPMEN